MQVLALRALRPGPVWKQGANRTPRRKTLGTGQLRLLRLLLRHLKMLLLRHLMKRYG